MKAQIVPLTAAMMLFVASGPSPAADSIQTSNEFRTSKVVGSRVYNEANENIGTVDDIVLKADGAMDEVVLSVGGYLGMDFKYVSVPFSDLKMSRDGTSVTIITKGTKAALKALPDYKFYGS